MDIAIEEGNNLAKLLIGHKIGSTPTIVDKVSTANATMQQRQDNLDSPTESDHGRKKVTRSGTAISTRRSSNLGEGRVDALFTEAAYLSLSDKCAGRTAAQSAAGGLSVSTEDTTTRVSPPAYLAAFGGLYGRAAKDCGIRAY